MHYSTLIITAKEPTEADIERILEPFNEMTYYDKISELEEKYGVYGAEEVCKFVERPIFTWDWYEIGGRWQAAFEIRNEGGKVDIAPIDDLVNFDEVRTFNCIDDVNGDVITQEYWNGKELIDDDDYFNKLAAIKERNKGKGYYVTMVDIHD